jgi:hypothetical protein
MSPKRLTVGDILHHITQLDDRDRRVLGQRLAAEDCLAGWRVVRPRYVPPHLDGLRGLQLTLVLLLDREDNEGSRRTKPLYEADIIRHLWPDDARRAVSTCGTVRAPTLLSRLRKLVHDANKTLALYHHRIMVYRPKQSHLALMLTRPSNK